MPQVSLEQWQALLAVVDQGGYAAAAESLNKSQSSVSYAIQKLESCLNIQVFKVEGRKAVLTPAGKTLYQRAQVLVEEARLVEGLAEQFAQGWEAELCIAMDTLFPEEVMLEVIAQFSQETPLTRVRLMETVLSGTSEALLQKQADLVIGALTPPGFIGQHLMNVKFVPAAAPMHPLHQLKRNLNYHDLRVHRQLVVTDSGSRDMDSGWLGAQQRLTVSHIRTSIEAAIKGLGYAWYPEMKIQQHLENGELKILPLPDVEKDDISLKLIFANGDFSGPACRRIAELLQEKVADIN